MSKLKVFLLGIENLIQAKYSSVSHMDKYPADHLELTIPDDLTKGIAQTSLSISSTVAQQGHSLKFSMPDEPVAFTIVSLSKKKQPDQCKAKGVPNQAAKRTIKKMTSGLLRPRPQKTIKSNAKKQNIMSKEELQSKIKQSEERKNRTKKQQKLVQPLQFLQIKSFNLNEQLEKLKSSRRSSRKQKHQQHSTQDIQKLLLSTKSIDNFGERTTEDPQSSQTVRISLGNEGRAYEQLQGKLEEKESKKGKCFYDKLKERLTIQIKQIKEKQKLDMTDPLLSACNMKKYPTQEIKGKFRNAITERSRPRTALTRTGLQSCKSQCAVARKRPQSTSAKILQKRQLEYMSQKMQEQQQRQLQNYSRIHSTKSKNRRSRVAYSPDSSITFKHVTPMHQRDDYIPSHSQIQKEKIKQKMLNILIDCHAESSNHENLEDGIKVFEKYCQKMDHNLGRMGKMIGRIQKTEAFDEDVEYL